jgi:hypothetical protein
VEGLPPPGKVHLPLARKLHHATHCDRRFCCNHRGCGHDRPVRARRSCAPPPQILVSAGNITVTAQGSTHVNNQFPWYVKDGSGAKVKQLTDFSFTGGSAGAPTIAAVSGAPATATLRGGYCQATGCYTFTASCTASSCTITGI